MNLTYFRIRRVFIVGQSDDQNVADSVLNEAEKHDDILMVSWKTGIIFNISVAR